MSWKVLLSIVALGLAAPVTSAQQHAAPTSKIVVVRMVDKSPTEFAFEPALVTVNPGDVVKFEQTGNTPHNVDFRSGPDGGNLKGTVSDYLVQAGQTYEVKIDERFGIGVHEFVCTPHELMGMKGTIKVEAAN